MKICFDKGNLTDGLCVINTEGFGNGFIETGETTTIMIGILLFILGWKLGDIIRKKISEKDRGK